MLSLSTVTTPHLLTPAKEHGIQRRVSLLYTGTAAAYLVFAVPAGRIANQFGTAGDPARRARADGVGLPGDARPGRGSARCRGVHCPDGRLLLDDLDGVLMALVSGVCPPALRATGMAVAGTVTGAGRFVGALASAHCGPRTTRMLPPWCSQVHWRVRWSSPRSFSGSRRAGTASPHGHDAQVAGSPAGRAVRAAGVAVTGGYIWVTTASAPAIAKVALQPMVTSPLMSPAGSAGAARRSGEPDAAGRRQSPRAVCDAGRAHAGETKSATPAGDSVGVAVLVRPRPIPTEAPLFLVRHTGMDMSYGALAAEFTTASTPRQATALHCEVVHFAGGRGVCLEARRRTDARPPSQPSCSMPLFSPQQRFHYPVRPAGAQCLPPSLEPLRIAARSPFRWRAERRPASRGKVAAVRMAVHVSGPCLVLRVFTGSVGVLTVGGGVRQSTISGNC